MENKNIFENGYKQLIIAVEKGAGDKNNCIENAVGEVTINDITYQIQIKLVKKELWISEQNVESSYNTTTNEVT